MTKAEESEWREGWRIVAACGMANATGVSLLFYTFSIFLIPVTAELGLSRGEAGIIQSLIITAALGAPLIGWALDRLGFTMVFIAATTALALTELFMARASASPLNFAAGVALAGFIGGGASSVLLTRPINAHFSRYRGTALGLMAAAVSLTTIPAPPILEYVIAHSGWRDGYLALAVIAGVIGMPLALLLLPRRNAATAPVLKPLPLPGRKGDRGFMGQRDFWFLVGAAMLTNFAIAGAIGHLSPMLQAEGLSPAHAALGISVFAAGQLLGKLAGGWLFDLIDPRRASIALTMAPSLGFAVFLMDGAPDMAVLAAAGLLGILQGADVGIFSYLVAHRFGVARYGTIFGALHGFGWIGTAAGLMAFGFGFDIYGTYAQVQAIGIIALVVGALLFVPFRLERAETA